MDSRCLVVLLSASAGDRASAIASVAAARHCGSGDFREVAVMPLSPRDDDGDPLRAAATYAVGNGFGWMLVLGEGETVVPDIFAKSAPALRLHHAVWGAAAVARPDGPPAFAPLSRLAAQDLASFFHCALRWWIGQSHFVRPAAAMQALDAAGGSIDQAGYMLALWRGVRAGKTAQAFTVFRTELPPVPTVVRERLLEDLRHRPVFMNVSHGNGTVRLPYTGRNAGIERAQTRGQFFEHEELGFLAGQLPGGLRIVDAGANTGNHTVFFATAMAAEIVQPIEPDAEAAAAIRLAVDANRLVNVDLALLGHAVGAAPARMRAVASPDGGLGATRLVPDPDGTVAVQPLDALVDGRVDLLKIDVEGMEMAVLAGAARLLAQHRPALFIEVMDAATADFLRWADTNFYRVEKLFPDKTHCNFYMVPAR